MIAKKYMLVLAAALVAAAPAHAQRVSLADRVAALEAKANNPQQNLDLLNRVTQQETELRELRAQLEQLQNENEQLKQRNRDQYLDLDGRLNRLEGGAAPVTPAPAATPPLSSTPTSAPATAPAPAVAPATTERPPSVHGDLGAMSAAGDERTAYNVAFDKLKFVDTPVPSTSASTSSGGGAGMRPGTTTGAAPSASTSSTTKSNPWYPDHAVFSATKDQLKSMPQFKYTE